MGLVRSIRNVMGSKKIILFDFDGVIVDSFNIAYESTTKVLGDIGEDVYRGFFKGNIYKSEAVQENTKLNGDDMVTDDDPFFKYYGPALLGIDPVPGIKKALRSLGEEYRMVVVSSAINGPIENFLKMHGMLGWFERIYGASVHTDKAVKIRMVFDDFGVVADDCMFVTDTLGDLREASSVGIRSIGVSWGFHTHETLTEGESVGIVNTVEALSGLIRNKI